MRVSHTSTMFGPHVAKLRLAARSGPGGEPAGLGYPIVANSITRRAAPSRRNGSCGSASRDPVAKRRPRRNWKVACTRLTGSSGSLPSMTSTATPTLSARCWPIRGRRAPMRSSSAAMSRPARLPAPRLIAWKRRAETCTGCAATGNARRRRPSMVRGRRGRQRRRDVGVHRAAARARARPRAG